MIDRGEFEGAIIRRFGRALTEQEKRILEALEEGEELDDLYAAEFWRKEDESFPWVLTMFAAFAAAHALAMLPEGVDDLTRESTLGAVEQMARDAGMTLIKGINDTSREQLTPILDQWFAGGLTREELEARIGAIFGPERAARIGITETTRISEAGKMEAVMRLVEQGLGVTAIFHQNSEYEACACHPLDGTEVDWRDPSVIPPLHVNCDCELEYRVAGA